MLHTFSGPDGAEPQAPLTLGNNGNFNGTTSNSDSVADGYGTVFMITPSGTLTTLYRITGGNGTGPQAGLTLGSDGNFYGTTSYADLENVNLSADHSAHGLLGGGVEIGAQLSRIGAGVLEIRDPSACVVDLRERGLSGRLCAPSQTIERRMTLRGRITVRALLRVCPCA